MLTKNKKFTTTYLAVFCILQAVLGYFIQNSEGFSFGIFCVCIIFLSLTTVLIFYKRTYVHLLTAVALFFTLIADFLLSHLIDFENINLFAMFSFSIVQICYFLRLYKNQKYTSEKRIHLIIRAILISAVLITTIIVLKSNVNALALVSMFYFSMLSLNLIYAFIQFKLSPVFAVGLFLFLLCDICVGFSMLSDFLPIAEDSFINVINGLPVNLAWVFYTPSQTLIAVDCVIQKD